MWYEVNMAYRETHFLSSNYCLVCFLGVKFVSVLCWQHRCLILKALLHRMAEPTNKQLIQRQHLTQREVIAFHLFRPCSKHLIQRQDWGAFSLAFQVSHHSRLSIFKFTSTLHIHSFNKAVGATFQLRAEEGSKKRFHIIGFVVCETPQPWQRLAHRPHSYALSPINGWKKKPLPLSSTVNSLGEKNINRKGDILSMKKILGNND